MINGSHVQRLLVHVHMYTIYFLSVVLVLGKDVVRLCSYRVKSEGSYNMYNKLYQHIVFHQEGRRDSGVRGSRVILPSTGLFYLSGLQNPGRDHDQMLLSDLRLDTFEPKKIQTNL